MELTFLGTSSGAPTLNRNVTGLAVAPEGSKRWFLVDCGEGTQHQVLKSHLNLNQLSAILITHVHGDHCYGLPGLLASAGMHGRTEPLLIVAPEAIQQMFEAVASASDLHLPYPIEFIDVAEWGGGLVRDGLILDAHRLSHRVPSWGFSFTEAEVERRLDTQKLQQMGIPAGPLWGQLQAGQSIEFDGQTIFGEDALLPGRQPRRVVVGGDNDTPALLEEACQQAQLLVHEATYTRVIADKVGDAPGHSSADKVALFAREVGLANLILTHFSARFQSDLSRSPNVGEIEQEAKSIYQGALWLAQDFDRYTLDRQGQLHLTQRDPI